MKGLIFGQWFLNQHSLVLPPPLPFKANFSLAPPVICKPHLFRDIISNSGSKLSQKELFKITFLSWVMDTIVAYVVSTETEKRKAIQANRIYFFHNLKVSN